DWQAWMIALIFEPRPFGPTKMPMRKKATAFSYIGTRWPDWSKVGEDSDLSTANHGADESELPLQAVSNLQNPVVLMVVVAAVVKAGILVHVVRPYRDAIQVERSGRGSGSAGQKRRRLGQVHRHHRMV